MRVVVQRVRRASVTVGENVRGRVGRGLVVLVGVARGDSEESARWLAAKCADLRIFEDEEGKMNLSARDIGAGFLVAGAAPPEDAERLYRVFADDLRGMGFEVEEGVFQEKMLVEIHNDGPVTVVIEKT